MDAAGIIFYPRYFELLARAFPRFSSLQPVSRLRTEFRKPNRLGDRLRLVETFDSTAGTWRYRGLTEDSEHFWIDVEPEVSRIPALEPGVADFSTTEFEISPWQAGPDGRLHLSRYFEGINSAVEQWFEVGLDYPFPVLHTTLRHGVPTVSMETSVFRLPRLGENCDYQIRPLRISRSSFQFVSTLMGGSRVCLQTVQTLVYIEHAGSGIRAMAIPEKLQNGLQDQLARGRSE